MNQKEQIKQVQEMVENAIDSIRKEYHMGFETHDQNNIRVWLSSAHRLLSAALTTPHPEASDREIAEHFVALVQAKRGYESQSEDELTDEISTIRADERRKADRLIDGIKAYMIAYGPGHISLDLSAYDEMVSIIGETTP